MSTAKVTKTAKVEAKTADKENVKTTAVKTEAPVKAATKTEPAKTTKAAAKAEPAKTTKAAAKAEPAKTTKAAAKAEPAKTAKAAAKAEPAKTAKAAAKAEPAKTTKTTTVKKAATPKTTTAKATEEVFIQYGGGEVSTSDIIARVVEATGKKSSSIKALNVYIQPETGKIYYTADGMSGEIAY